MEDERNVDAVETDGALADRPRAADWIWRPWYAKLYWSAALLYWSVFLASWIWRLLPDFFSSVGGAYLGLAFHPLTVLIVLGFGFVRAFFSTGEWEWVERTHEEGIPRKSVGGLRNPYADPLDPRSGMNWIGHPSKIAEPFNKRWP